MRPPPFFRRQPQTTALQVADPLPHRQVPRTMNPEGPKIQDHGLSLRGGAFMTVLAALTVLAVLESTLPSFSWSYKIQNKEVTVTVLTVFGGCGGFGHEQGPLVWDIPRSRL